MTEQSGAQSDSTACPNCGASVVYRGVGRRPVWCSTRCRNDASLKRLGARRAAVEVRVVEVIRNRPETRDDQMESAPVVDSRRGTVAGEGALRPPTPSVDQALRVVRNDPAAVGKLLAHLERRRMDGALATAEWLPVRNALRLIAGQLLPGVERPT